MSKHTPGPWELHKPAFGEQHIYVNSDHTVHGMKTKSGRQHICVVPYEGKKGAVAYHEMFNANARLIAAAPDLLEALKVMVEQFTKGSSPSTLKDSEARIKAHAAIAKATGENQ